MEIYRIVATRWANSLFGSGRASRWNSKNAAVLYFSENRSLAILENLAHRNGFDLHGIPFSLVTVEIPDDEIVIANNLLPGWKLFDNNAYIICRQIGDTWVRNNSSLGLKVPSVIEQHEFNIIVNPNHPNINQLKIISIDPFTFDSRI